MTLAGDLDSAEWLLDVAQAQRDHADAVRTESRHREWLWLVLDDLRRWGLADKPTIGAIRAVREDAAA